MTVRIGALVLATSAIDEVVAFYRALGMPLEEERHDEGPVHYACDLSGCHFAVFPAEGGDGRAPGRSMPGSSFIGIAVPSIDEACTVVQQLGATVHQQPDDYPWGRRAVVEDPDGRPVELFTPAR